MMDGSFEYGDDYQLIPLVELLYVSLCPPKFMIPMNRIFLISLTNLGQL